MHQRPHKYDTYNEAHNGQHEAYNDAHNCTDEQSHDADCNVSVSNASGHMSVRSWVVLKNTGFVVLHVAQHRTRALTICLLLACSASTRANARLPGRDGDGHDDGNGDGSPNGGGELDGDGEDGANTLPTMVATDDSACHTRHRHTVSTCQAGEGRRTAGSQGRHRAHR